MVAPFPAFGLDGASFSIGRRVRTNSTDLTTQDFQTFSPRDGFFLKFRKIETLHLAP